MYTKAPFDLTAYVVASVVGGLVVWAWGFLSGHSVASSVAYLVLLVPFFALASAIGIGLFVVPAWLILGKSWCGAPAPFSVLLGFVSSVVGAAIGLWSGMSLPEVLFASVPSFVWFCVVAATYSGWARASLTPPSSGQPPAAAHVER
ncbi:hypothetical protein [Methylibium rhizosphaerae]|uniref:hypothetical protein n=1 Tax=Methylibium rhizosphaerae TaxID=2570323 RepID=UPI0011273FAB|nr:hypothetical protein [Methylibium rhizosphaerae]